MLALSCWRISNLFVYENGPFDVFLKLRNVVGAGDIDVEPTNFFGKLLNCIGCTSIWVAAALVILFVCLPKITAFILVAGSISAAAYIIDQKLLD